MRANLLIVAVALLVRLPMLGWPLEYDERVYADTAARWLAGEHLYVAYLGVEKPQGLYLAYLLTLPFGSSPAAVHLLAALWAVVGALGVAAVARHLSDARGGLAAGLLYAVAASLPGVDGWQLNGEHLMAPLLIWSAWALLGRRWMAAGVLAGLAVECKLSAVAGILLALCWAWSRGDGWRRVALGTALPVVAFALHGVWSAGAAAYLDNVLLYRLTTRDLFLHADPLTLLVRGWVGAGSYGLAPWQAWAPPAVLALPWLATSPDRGARRFCCAWLALALFGAGLGGQWFPSYFVPLLAPLAVMAGLGLRALLTATRRPGRVALAGLLACALLWEASAAVAGDANRRSSDTVASGFWSPR